MYPVVRALICCTFHYQLVELAVHEVDEPLAEFLHVAQVNFTGFAFHVLAGLASSNGCIELRATIAGTDDDWFFDYVTQGFENFGAEGSQGRNEVLRNLVVDAYETTVYE